MRRAQQKPSVPRAVDRFHREDCTPSLTLELLGRFVVAVFFRAYAQQRWRPSKRQRGVARCHVSKVVRGHGTVPTVRWRDRIRITAERLNWRLLSGACAPVQKAEADNCRQSDAATAPFRAAR